LISLFFFSADIESRVERKHRLVIDCAKAAEAAGLHAVWVPERHFDPFGAPYPNPLLLLAAIAAQTERIQLRAGSIVLPLHDPLTVAEDIAVVQSLSLGRLGISLASGWHPEDFVLNPGAYDTRKDDLLQKYDALRRLWSGQALSRQGPRGQVAVRTYPALARPPEFWLTSSANIETWRQAGRLGINVLTGLLEQSVDDLTAKIAAYTESLRASGHDPVTRQVTCMLHTHVTAREPDVTGRVTAPMTRYLTAHLKLFEKSLGSDSGIRADSVTAEDRRVILANGVQRYLRTSGLFGSPADCLPLIERLWTAGVTEFGCLVDFGLPDHQVLECVDELGHLQRALARTRPVEGQ
jgi:natural product biosynthesis luciferase-like monooxygenase protein